MDQDHDPEDLIHRFEDLMDRNNIHNIQIGRASGRFGRFNTRGEDLDSYLRNGEDLTAEQVVDLLWINLDPKSFLLLTRLFLEIVCSDNNISEPLFAMIELKFRYPDPETLLKDQQFIEQSIHHSLEFEKSSRELVNFFEEQDRLYCTPQQNYQQNDDEYNEDDYLFSSDYYSPMDTDEELEAKSQYKQLHAKRGFSLQEDIMIRYAIQKSRQHS